MVDPRFGVSGVLTNGQNFCRVSFVKLSILPLLAKILNTTYHKRK